MDRDNKKDDVYYLTVLMIATENAFIKIVIIALVVVGALLLAHPLTRYEISSDRVFVLGLYFSLVYVFLVVCEYINITREHKKQIKYEKEKQKQEQEQEHGAINNLL